MPSEMTSIPAAFLSAIFFSSWAKRYGGIRSSRLLGLMELLDEVLGELASEDRDGPAGQVHVQVLGDLDLQLTAVEHDGDGREVGIVAPAAAQHVRDRGAGRAGAGGERLADAALEDARADA